MAWSDLARVKRFLAIAETDTADDAVIQDSLDAAQHLALTLRAGSGYVDDPNTSPNAGATEGVTRWAALLFQARGTGEGFAGFIDTGAVIGTPYYESRRMILMLLGVPRPTVDGVAADAAAWEFVRYSPDGSVQLDAAPFVSVPQGTEPEHAARRSDIGASALAEFYYDKASDVIDVAAWPTYTPLNVMPVTDMPTGVYLVGLSVSYTYPTTSRSVFFRWRTEPGAAWNEFVHEPGDTTDVVPLVYTFPRGYGGAPFTFELEAAKESGGGGAQLDVLFSDVWAQRVA